MKILIIGGTSGIGYYVGEKLNKRGHKVIIGTHTIGECNSLKKKNPNIGAYKIDICNKKDLILLDKLDYDVLWLNQAIGTGGSILSVKENLIRKSYETNVFGNILAIRKAYKNMSNRKIKGKIIVTSSLIKNLDLKYLGIYTSTKAALSKICFILKNELKEVKSDISLTLLELGAYHTGFNQAMIDNKYINMSRDEFYNHNNKISNSQRLLFSLIEKKNYSDITKAIIKLIEKNKKNSLIKRPILQSIFTKLYDFFWH